MDSRVSPELEECALTHIRQRRKCVNSRLAALALVSLKIATPFVTSRRTDFMTNSFTAITGGFTL